MDDVARNYADKLCKNYKLSSTANDYDFLKRSIREMVVDETMKDNFAKIFYLIMNYLLGNCVKLSPHISPRSDSGLFQYNFSNGDQRLCFTFFENGTMAGIDFLINNILQDPQMDDVVFPARCLFHHNGNLWKMEWYIDGVKMKESSRHLNGKKQFRRTFLNGMQNSIDDNPAEEIFNEEGLLEWQIWKKDNILHRSVGPAVIEWHADGSKQTEYWFVNGMNVNEDENKPVRVDYNANNIVRSIHWNRRVDQPYRVDFFQNGNKRKIYWNRYDQILPTIESYYPNGQLATREWLNVAGRLNRSRGPAKITFTQLGYLLSKSWYNNGQRKVQDGFGEILGYRPADPFPRRHRRAQPFSANNPNEISKIIYEYEISANNKILNTVTRYYDINGNELERVDYEL